MQKIFKCCLYFEFAKQVKAEFDNYARVNCLHLSFGWYVNMVDMLISDIYDWFNKLTDFIPVLKPFYYYLRGPSFV